MIDNSARFNVFLLPAGRFNALRRGDKYAYAIALTRLNLF